MITICNLNQYQTENTFEIVKKFTLENEEIPKSLKNIFLIDKLIPENNTYKQSFSMRH